MIQANDAVDPIERVAQRCCCHAAIQWGILPIQSQQRPVRMHLFLDDDGISLVFFTLP